MFRLFSFSGRTRPRPYVLSSLAVFFGQHLITILVLAAEGVSLGAATKDWQFYVMPLQTLAKHSGASALTLVGTLRPVDRVLGIGGVGIPQSRRC
jgi:hypothetical protein